MTTPYDTYKNAVLGVPFDPNKKPSRQGAVRAFSEMQRQLEGAQSGALVKDTLVNLQALTEVSEASIMAWVVSDVLQSNNGIYENTGTALAPAWTRRADIPQFVISAINEGNGTANAIEVSTDLSIPVENARCLIIVPIVVDNTGSTTISFNDGTSKTIKSISGSDVLSGSLLSGMVVTGYISDNEFRLITDIASSSIVAQAEAARDAALAVVQYSYQIRNQSTADLVNLLPNETIFSIAGHIYQKDNSVLIANSALKDFNVSGVKPFGDLYYLEQFGCALDGSLETVKVQTAFDLANEKKASITSGFGTLKSGMITCEAGVLNILLGNIEWIGDVALTTSPRIDVTQKPLINSRRYELKMNMSNGDLIGIEGLLINSDFGGVHIYGYTNNVLLNHIGIRPQAGSDNCDFRGYHWEGYDNPTQRGIGVHCTATVAAYAGYFPSGALVRATVPVTNMRIHGAVFINGSYAWVPNGSEYCTFADNYCEGQNHRGVQFTAGCYRCATSNNIFKDFKSSAVLFSYGTTECSSFGDTVDVATYTGGEACFNINTGAVGTKVMGAKGYAGMNFFAYVATGARKTVIEGCVGEGFYVGGVVVQSDWADPADPNRAGLIFDRSNYGATGPDSPTGAWAFTDLDNVIVRNNSMGKGYTGRNTIAYGAIQVDSADGSSAYDCRATFQGNIVHDTSQVSFDFAAWKESGDCKVRLVGNDFRANGYKAAYGGASVSWHDFIERWADNGAFDQTVINEGITLDGTTPSVVTPAPNGFTQVFTLGHTTATDVTNFIDGFNGQTIRLWGSVNATIKYNSGLIRTNGNTDVTMNSNQMIEFVRRSNIWFETNRNF